MFLSRLSSFWGVEGSAAEDNKTEKLKISSEDRLSDVEVVIFYSSANCTLSIAQGPLSAFGVFLSFAGLQVATPNESVQRGVTEDRSSDRSWTSTFLYQTMALLKKRLLTFRRDKKMWAFVVLMPIVFIGTGALLILDFDIKDQPALALSPQVRCLMRKMLPILPRDEKNGLPQQG